LFGAGYAGDTLRVCGINCIGTSAERKLRINANVPGTPSSISGQANGLCNLSGITYSISATANATSYTWRTTATGATINGSSSPVTTTSLSVSASFTNFLSGQIFVKANNGCGSGAERSLTITGRPAAPVSISGPVSVCQGQTGVAYSTPVVPFTTSYNWIVPNGSTIASGQNTNNIVVNYGASSTSGQVRVRTTNACGSSGYFAMNVAVSSCLHGEGNSIETNNLVMDIYPNPAHEMINVNLKSVESDNYICIITDVTGRVVFKETISAIKGENLYSIDVTSFSEGSYLLIMQSDKDLLKQHIIIE
jgi:hypothetical protein